MHAARSVQPRGHKKIQFRQGGTYRHAAAARPRRCSYPGLVPFREQALKESRRRTTSRPRTGRPDPEGAGGRAAGCPPRWYVPQRPAAHTRTSRSPGEHELQEQGACHQPRIVDRGAWQSDRGAWQSTKARLKPRPSHVQGSRIRWRRHPGPAPGVSGPSSAAGPWPTVCPPPTRHLAARDLREIRTLIRTLLDARSLGATASAKRHGRPTVRHGGIQRTRPGVKPSLPHPRRCTGHPVHEWENQAFPMAPASLLRPTARWYVPHQPGTR